MADNAHRLTDIKLEEMEERLSAIYSTAQKGIQQKADRFFAKFEEMDAKKRALVKDGKITEKEYATWRQNKILYSGRFEAMQEDIARNLAKVNETATAYINGELPEVYATNYNQLADAVDGVGGYSFTLTDANTVRELAVNDKSLLPYKKLDPEKDIPWNMKNINREVLQGIIQGESIPDISKRMANVGDLNKTQAVRTARTIVTGAENKGRQDSYAQAESDGIILQKEWLATNDSRTRHAHSHLDGVIVDQDKPFETVLWLSKTKRQPDSIMFPGDPSAHPANVYNCRCSMAAVVKGFKKTQVQKAMDEPAIKRNVPPSQQELKEAYESVETMWDMSPQERYDLAKMFSTQTATSENFYENSVGFWELKKSSPRRPADHISYSRRTGKISSKYWYTEEGVYRQSDHWGSDVASCSWYINGRRYSNDGVSKGSKETAFVKWDDLYAKGIIGKAGKQNVLGLKEGTYFLSGFKFKK